MWSTTSKKNCKSQAQNPKEPIQLLRPIEKNNNKNKNSASTATATFIGGNASFYIQDLKIQTNPKTQSKTHPNPKCSICSKDLYLLVQLYAPIHNLHRTLYVFGCNTFECCKGWNGAEDQLEESSKNSNGCFKCIRSQTPVHAIEPQNDDNDDADDDKETFKSDVDDDIVDDDDFDWGGEDDDDMNLQQLEDMICKLDTNTNNTETNENSPKNKTSNCLKSKEETNTSPANTIEHKTLQSNEVESNNFPSYEVEWINEPKTDARTFTDDDDSTSTSDDENTVTVDDMKIELMLHKYLQTEEDDDIIQSLQSNLSGLKNDLNTSSIQNPKTVPRQLSNRDTSGGGEAYERLPPKQQVFYTFTSRIKRAPNQVLRYAYGGIPMWSIPCVNIISDQDSDIKQTHQKIQPNNKNNRQSIIPKCKCGATREFEFQIMPSILHILNVDQIHNDTTFSNLKDKKEHLLSNLSSKKQNENDSKDDAAAMNWGIIAVYSCSASCEFSREEYVIVQSSV